jgi:hypothetical protein
LFELDREVTAWSEAVHADRCRGSASVDELRDHLYCEIDRARAEGLSDEQAFAAAVAKLGPATTLASEHAKNRSLLGTLCAAAARLERGESSAQARSLLMAHAIVWASVMIATALMMKKSAGVQATEWLILLILIPSWLGSEQILRRALRSRSRGGAR